MIDQEPKQVFKGIHNQSSHQEFSFDQRYQEFRKLYLSNRVLQTKIQELEAERQLLLQKIQKAQKGEYPSENPESLNQDRKKRVRRVASQIKRHYECQYPNCTKSYGSEGSLNQHIKFKHPALYEQLFKDKIDDKVEIKDEQSNKDYSPNNHKQNISPQSNNVNNVSSGSGQDPIMHPAHN